MTTSPPGAPFHSSPFHRRDQGSRRVTWSSFGVSVGIHVLLLAGAALGIALPSPESNPVVRAITPADQGVEIVWILGGSPPPPAAAARPEEPAAIAAGAAPQVIVVRPELGNTGPQLDLPPLTGPGRPGETPAQRLQPALTDERIWAPLPPEFRTLTPTQREELLIAGRLGAWNDSVAAALAADAAWRDWTYTDGDGDRWGVADGQLYLGGLVIPFPMTFAGSSDDRAYMREFEELQRQGANALVQQSVRERMEAIRVRRDRERAEAQPPADTARTSPR
ncbi:MAG: hypothetical protein ABL963_08445 [Longimicrobiales bacterium]